MDTTVQGRRPGDGVLKFFNFMAARKITRLLFFVVILVALAISWWIAVVIAFFGFLVTVYRRVMLRGVKGEMPPSPPVDIEDFLKEVGGVK